MPSLLYLTNHMPRTRLTSYGLNLHPEVGMERPQSVVWGLILWWAQAAVGVVSGIVPPRTGPIVDPQAGMEALVFLFVMWVIIFLSFVFLLIETWQGKNWARVTLLVMSVLGLPFIPWGDAIGLGQTSIQFVALVLLFVPASNQWFRLVKAARLRQDLEKLGSQPTGRA